MTNAQYRARQRKLRRQIQDELIQIQEMLGCEIQKPTLATLRRRERAAFRLENLVVELWWSITVQIVDAKK